MKTKISGNKSLTGLLMICLITLSAMYIYADYSNWVDTDWSGGVGTSPGQYASKDAYINTSGGQLKLGVESFTISETTYNDFADGIATKAQITGSGTPSDPAAGALELTPAVSDPFASGLREWLSLPPIPAIGPYSRYTRMGGYIYCIFGSGDGKQFGRISVSSLTNNNKMNPPKWEFLAPVPLPVSGGTAITNDGEYIYVLRGAGSNKVYFYLPPDSTDPDPSDVKFPFSSPAPGEWKEFGSLSVSLPVNICNGSGIVHTGSPLSALSGGKLFVLRGSNTADFRCYDTGLGGGRWRDRSSIPGGEVIGAGGALAHKPGTDFIYAVGMTSSLEKSKIYRYSISGNAWSTAIDAIPTNSNGYTPTFGSGWFASNVYYNSSICYPGYGNALYAVWLSSYASPDFTLPSCRAFFKFDLTTNKWTRLDDAPMDVSSGYYGAIIYDPDGTGNRLHLFSGQNYTRPWEYSITDQKWNTLSQPPVLSTYGINLCYPGTGDYIYYVAGGGASYFLRYSISRNRWERLCNLPSPVNNSGKHLTYLNGYIYYLTGNNCGTSDNTTRNFFRYDISQAPGSDAWQETLAPFPFYDGVDADTLNDLHHGAGITGVRIGSNDYIYGLRGSECTASGKSFYRYDVAANVWTPMANTPSAFYGSFIIYSNYAVGGYTYIYASRGYSDRKLYRYGPIEEDANLSDDINGDGYTTGVWTEMASAPNPNFTFSSSYGNSLSVSGSGRYIYAFTGELDNKGGMLGSAVYDIETNSWEALEPTPFASGFSCSAAAGDYIYLVKRYPGNYFYRYNIAAREWDPAVSDQYQNQSGNMVVDRSNNIYAIYGFSDYSMATTASHIWVYTPSERRWTGLIRAPFEMSVGTKGAYIESENAIYLTKGLSPSGRFYKYDIDTNTWSEKDPNSRQFWRATQIVVGEQGLSGKVIYAKTGTNGNSIDIYYPGFNYWSTLRSDAPSSDCLSNIMVYVKKDAQDILYMLEKDKDDLYCYNVTGNSWNTLRKIGDESGSGESTLKVGSGSVIYNHPGTNYLYCIPIEGFNYFLRYDISTNQWLRLPPLPRTGSAYSSSIVSTDKPWLFVYNSKLGESFIRYYMSQSVWDQISVMPEIMSDGSAMCGFGGYLYYLCGDNGNPGVDADAGTFWRYTPSSDLWEKLTSAGYRFCNSGVSMIPVTYQGQLSFYFTTGASTSDFYRYDIPTNTWEQLESLPSGYSFGHGNSLAAAGNCIYATLGGLTPYLFKYDMSAPQGSRWSFVGNISGNPSTNYGTSLVYPGGNWIYLLAGNNSPEMKRYNYISGLWDTGILAACPVSPGKESRSKLIYPGFGDYFYYLQTTPYSTSEESFIFLRYSVSLDKWEELNPAPFGIRGLGALAFAGDEYFYVTKGISRDDITKYYAFSFGQYISDIKEVGKHSGWGNVSWVKNNLQNTEVAFRSGNQSNLSDAVDWGKAVNVSNNSDLSNSSAVHDTDRYFQYKISFATDNLSEIPRLDSLQLVWERYFKGSQSLASRVLDSGAALNRIMGISWNQSLPSAGGADIRFQLRTSPDGSSWTGWLGSLGTQEFAYTLDSISSYQTDPYINISGGTARLYKDLEDFPYSQIIVFDNSANGPATDTIVSLMITSQNKHFWSNIRSDGANIRFYDNDTGYKKKLDYFLPYFNYSKKEAVINIKTDLPDHAVKNIHLLYGSNSGISESQSSIRNYNNFKNDPNLVAWWDFEEGSGVFANDVASLGGNNALALKESAKWINDGAFGTKAISLDGVSDYLYANPSSYLPYRGQGKTFSIWVRRREDPNGGYLISSTSPYNYRFVMQSQGNMWISLKNAQDSNQSGADWATYTQQTVPLDNKWHNLSIVLRPTRLVEVYVDGEKGPDSYTHSIAAWDNVGPSDNMTVGVVHNSSTPYSQKIYYYNGDVDFFSIFERDLSDNEIKDLYYGSVLLSKPCSFYVNEESVTPPAGSGLEGWTYRVPIVLDNSLVSSGGTRMATINIANWYQLWLHAKPDGGDIRVADSNGTVFADGNYRLYTWDSATKKATVRAKIDMLAGETKTIYLYYGKSDAVTTGTLFPTISFSGTVIYPYQAPAANTFNTGKYYTTNPVIQPIFGVFYNNDIALFTEYSSNKNPPNIDIGYQVSPDGYHWYWWNGSSWAEITGGYTQTNNASTVNTRLASLRAQFPSADFYWRAWLHSSDGSATPILDGIAVTLTSGVTYYINNTGGEPINLEHSKYLTNDRFMQYKATLYSDGESTPILNDVTIQYTTPVINITSPASGDQWAIGSDKTIRWTSSGLEDTTNGVRIQYWSSDIKDWVTIVEATPDDGEYLWTGIPDDPALVSYIRINSIYIPEIVGTSAPFIIKGVNIIWPNGKPPALGKQVLENNRTKAITWDSYLTIPRTDKLELRFSEDGGATYPPESKYLIASNQENDGNATWMVPVNLAGDNIKVKIFDIFDNEIVDTSDYSFAIVNQPAIKVNKPAGGEVFIVGQTTPIEWETNSQQFGPYFLIEYSADGGATWPYTQDPVANASYLIARVNSGAPVLLMAPNNHLTGSYTWTVPNTISGNVMIRIKEEAAPADRDTTTCVSGMTTSPFAISKSYITVTSPAGGEEWAVGDTRNVTWNTTGTFGPSATVTVQWSTDDFATVHEISSTCNTNAKTCPWTIPSEVVTSGYVNVRIRVIDNANPAAPKDSAVFTVYSGSLIIVEYPNGGESFTASTGDPKYNIIWRAIGQNADYPHTYQIYYSTTESPVWFPLPGASEQAIDQATHKGTFPNLALDIVTDYAKIKVVKDGDPGISDESDGFFTINRPVVELTSPLGGESWYASGSYNITWNTLGSTSSNISVKYSLDNGATWIPIAVTPEQITNKSCPWAVPNNIGSTVLVQVVDNAWVSKGYDVISTSGPVSIISPVITISSPAANDNWVVGTNRSVTWTTQGGEVGAIKKLKVQCIADATHTYEIGEITDPSAIVSNSGSVSWTVPANAPVSTTMNKAVMRISDPDSGTGVTAEKIFNIKEPSFIFNEPSSRPSWKIGSGHTISWTNLGSIQYPVKIYCRTSAGTEILLTEITDSGTTSYLWNTYAEGITLGTSYIILRDSHVPPIATKWNDPTLREGLFYVVSPTISVNKPAAGTKWTETDTRTVSWTCDGKIIGPLKVEWSKIVGGVEEIWPIAIAAGLNFDITEASWLIPHEAVNPNVRLIVTDTGSPWGTAGRSESFTVFAIPQFTSLTLNDINTGNPVGQIRAGNTYDIKWDDNGGAISNDLKLEYFTEAEGWRGLASSIPSAPPRIYRWTVPHSEPPAVFITPCNNSKIRISDNVPWQAGQPNTSLESAPVPLKRPVFENIILGKNTASTAHEQYIAIGESPVIKWNSDGHINADSLTIRLLIDGNPVATLASNRDNTGIHAGWVMPDISLTNNAKIMIEDAFADYGIGNEVKDASAVFSIIAKPEITVTSPDSTGDYVIDKDTIAIRWNSKGLSVENVKIEMSADDFATAPYTIAALVPNNGSFDWYIPDDPNVPAGAHLKIRVSMIGRESEVYGLSAGYFIIRSGFDITTPSKVATEIWITNEIRQIRWTTKGRIPTVNLYYSVDDGVTFKPIMTKDASGTDTPEIANTGVFSWKVPNERTDLGGTKARIKVKDPNATDPSCLIENVSSPFTISWHNIKFYIIDKDTYGPLVDLNVRSEEDLAQNYPGWEVVDFSVLSPVYHEFPAGHFSATWSTKPTSTGTPDYFDRGIEFDANEASVNKGVLVEMENRVSATIEWHVIITDAYTPSDDTLKVTAWIERRGRLQEPIPKDTTEPPDGIPDTLDKSNFKGCTLKVYDYDTNTDTPIMTFDALEPDDTGLYKFTWANTGLQVNRTYFVRASITYGEGGTYTSGASFDVSSTKAQAQMIQEHAEQTSLLQTIQTQATAIQTAVEQTIPQKITEAKVAIEAKVDATKAELKEDTARILTATEETIPAQITEKVEAVIRSEILNRESTMRLGSKLMVRYRTYPGLVPVVDVYSPLNELVISHAPMTEIIGSPGMYEYELVLKSGWRAGDYTIVCSETSKGTMDALIISAIRTDLEEVAGQVATIMGTTTSLANLKDIADTLNSQFSIIESALGKISTDLVNKVKEVASSATDIESVYSQLVNIGKELKTLGANQDVNLSKLLEVSKDKRQDLKYLRNKTQQLKAAMEINTKMVDSIAHKPVTQTWFEYK